jgi:transposase
MRRYSVQQMGIAVLEWPPLSPGLAPIENVWPWMKSAIEYSGDIQGLGLLKLQCHAGWRW